MSAQATSPPWAAVTDQLVVTVLGAGSPFTAALIDALVETFDAPSHNASARLSLRLVGRDVRAVSLLGRYATAALGESVVATDDLGALEGSDVVVVQIRPGGTTGRIADERLASSVGAPVDESLGVGGLSAMLRNAPVLRGLAGDLLARCPRALVLVLTNPLSTCVAVLRRAGINAVGGCELPTATASAAARALGLAPAELATEFSGLSHRGFLHGLTDRRDGSDVLPGLVGRLRRAGATLAGIGPDEIEFLGALPMKYHPLLTGRSMGSPGRASAVARMRSLALDELGRAPTRHPSALRGRATPWYDLVIVPLLAALAGVAPTRLFLDVGCVDGLVREHATFIDRTGFRSPAAIQLRGVAAPMVASYEAHERALLDLLALPSYEALAAAIDRDSSIPDHVKGLAAEALTPALGSLLDQPVAGQWSRT